MLLFSVELDGLHKLTVVRNMASGNTVLRYIIWYPVSPNSANRGLYAGTRMSETPQRVAFCDVWKVSKGVYGHWCI